MTTKMLNLQKNIKIFSLEAVRGMKLKLSRSVHNINKKFVFITVAHVLLSLWQLKVSIGLLYPRYTKYVGVYSFRFSVRPFVRTKFIHSFVCSSFRHRVKVFALKFIRPHILKTLLKHFVYIWHDGRYRSKVFISTIPTPRVTLGSRSRT